MKQISKDKPLILIMEDEGLISRMYSKKLEVDGYDCLVADNGKIGFDLAQENNPDLILCDIMMPEQDGITTLTKLKEDDDLKSIPVIMLTNVAQDQYIERAIDLGAASYLVKSQLVPADVVKKIKEILLATGKDNLLNK